MANVKRSNADDGTERFEGGLGGRALPDTGPGEHYEAQDGRGSSEGLANFLGWFSIALGTAQMLAPSAVAQLIGVKPTRRNIDTMRAFGMREMTSGIGILSKRQPAGWVWSRVAGDALDIAMLGRAMNTRGNDRVRAMGALVAVAGVTALDVLAAQRLSRPNSKRHGHDGHRDATIPGQQSRKDHSIRSTHVLTVNRPVQDVFDFWRNFENLPRFMRHLEAVEVLDNNRSRWTARAPAGAEVSWEAEITEEIPNELIAWRSLPGSTVPNAGSVRFASAPAGQGTEIRVELEYSPPGGVIGSKIAMLFREEPQTQIKDDLRHFKQVMEIGEVLLSDASVHKAPHPGQPHSHPVGVSAQKDGGANSGNRRPDKKSSSKAKTSTGDDTRAAL